MAKELTQSRRRRRAQKTGGGTTAGLSVSQPRLGNLLLARARCFRLRLPLIVFFLSHCSLLVVSHVDFESIFSSISGYILRIS